MRLNGDKVRTAREEKALSQYAAAKKAGIHPRTWQRAEGGQDIYPDTAARIAKVLGKDVAELVAREDIVPEKIAEPVLTLDALTGLEAYAAFVLNATSSWKLPKFARTFELDCIYVSERIREHVPPENIDLATAALTTAPVYRDDSLLTLFLDGEFQRKSATNHAQILGEPGSGKTTLMYRWANTLARDWLDSHESPFPVWLPFKEWAAWTPYQSPAQPLPRTAALLSAGHDIDGVSRALDGVLRSGNVIVLLDGLDELFDRSRKMIRSAFRSLQHTYPTARLVVTSRKVAYTQGLPGYTDFEILPFSGEQIATFVKKYFADGRERARDMLQEIESAPRFRDLAKTPLFLAIMCNVFDIGGSLPRTETRLYQLCIDQIIKDIPFEKDIIGMDRDAVAVRPKDSPTPAEMLAVLRALARETFTQEHDPLPREEAAKAAAGALQAIGSVKDPAMVVRFLEANTELLRGVGQLPV